MCEQGRAAKEREGTVAMLVIDVRDTCIKEQ